MLITLGDDVFAICCSFLTGSDVAALGATSKQQQKASSIEVIWRELLGRELAITIHEPLRYKFPPGVDDGECTVYTAKALYVQWRLKYPGCSTDEIKFVSTWWRRMESWLHNNTANSILQSLCAPATAASYADFELKAGRPLPRLLRLLYSFHDGQRLNNGGNVTALFGGYSPVYDYAAENWFVPLSSSSGLSKQISEVRSVGRGGRAVDLEVLTEFDDAALIHENEEPFTAFSYSFAAQTARGCIGDDVCVVSGRLLQWAISCVSRELRTSQTPALFLWLEEYVSRLERGIYRYEPVDLTAPERFLNRNYVPPHHISLFPHSDNAAVTRGIQVQPAALLLPEHMDLSRRQLFFAYTMRIQALPDHMPYNACQLGRRHWRITDHTGRVERVDGEGVIGLFPSFDKRRLSPVHFAYQSCTYGLPGGSMEGELDFFVGNLEEHTGETFAVTVPRFHFELPSFLF